MVEIISDKDRKARKPHICDYCGGTIATGEIYNHYRTAKRGIQKGAGKWLFTDADLTKTAILAARLLEHFPDIRHNENQYFGNRGGQA